MKKRMLTLFVLALIVALGVQSAWAAKYPERKIKLVCAWAAGGGSDIMARTLTRLVNQSLDGRMYVENITGATGLMGMREVLNAQPDGYTLMLLTTTNTIAPAVMKDYPTPDQLDPFNVAGEDPMIMVVGVDSPYKNAADFIAAAKANPGKLTVGTAGHGSPQHLAVAAFAAAAGIQLSYVPFKGAAPALVATVGRHVDMVAPGVSEAITLNEAKKIRALVSLSTKRLRHYPDAPTAKELGYDVVVSRWMGVAAPKGLPKDVKALLVDAFKKATDTEEFKKFNAQNGLEPFHGTPEEARTWIKNQADYFKKVADKAGIQPE